MNIHSIKKEYANSDITVLWQPALCEHSGVCVRNLASVFKPQTQPWIQLENATTAQIVATVQKCPSGALSMLTKEA